MRLRVLLFLLFSGAALAAPPAGGGSKADATKTTEAAKPAADAPKTGEGAAGQLKEGPPRANGMRNTEVTRAQKLAVLHRRCRLMEARVEMLEQELASMDADIADLQTAVHEAKGRKATDAALIALVDEMAAQRERSGQIYSEIAEIRVMHLREHIDAGDTDAKGCKVITIQVRPSDLHPEGEEEVPEGEVEEEESGEE